MNNKFLVKRGMVFLADLSNMGAIGSEQGTHENGSDLTPVLVLQNNSGNKFSPTIIIAILSSRFSKAKLPTHVELHKEVGLDKNSIVMLEQLKTIDKCRLKKACTKLDRETMERVDRAMNISLGQLDPRKEEILRQVEEVRYYIRVLEELKDDIYTSSEQIRQKVIRLSCEYSKLKKLCTLGRQDVESYIKLDEKEYLKLCGVKETIQSVYAAI